MLHTTCEHCHAWVGKEAGRPVTLSPHTWTCGSHWVGWLWPASQLRVNSSMTWWLSPPFVVPWIKLMPTALTKPPKPMLCIFHNPGKFPRISGWVKQWLTTTSTLCLCHWDLIMTDTDEVWLVKIPVHTANPYQSCIYQCPIFKQALMKGGLVTCWVHQGLMFDPLELSGNVSWFSHLS